MMLHTSKPLSTGTIETTGTLVILCTRVLFFVVLLCVRGVGRSPCSCVGILAAVLYVLCGGIEGVGGSGQTPSPSQYTVGAHGWMLVGGGGGGAVVT